MLYIIYLLAGVVIGVIITVAIMTASMLNITYGTIRQTHDDGDTYLFLELDRPPEDIKRRKRVIFKVNPKDYDTQN